MTKRIEGNGLQKRIENCWQKIKRPLIGGLFISSAVIGALPVSEVWACDPNNPDCANNPGYTATMVTKPDRTRIIDYNNVNGQRFRPAPGDRLFFGVQVLSILHRITDYDNGQTTFLVKDDQDGQGRLTCTSDYISKKDVCRATIYPSQN